MMSIAISWWGVILATILAMVVGSLWYSPMLFGKSWAKGNGVDPSTIKAPKPAALIVLLVMALLTAIGMNYVIVEANKYLGTSGLMGGLQTAFYLWLAFGATSIIAHSWLEPKPKSLIWINVGNRLVTYLVMGLILGAFIK